MKQTQRIMLLLILMLGSVFSSGCGQVEEVRLLLGKVKAQQVNIEAAEMKLATVLEAAAKQDSVVIAALDANGDGKVSKDEFTGNKAGVLSVLTTTFAKGNWLEIIGTMLSLILLFFGLHSADVNAKLRQYGTKGGVLGTIFKVAGMFGKEPKPGEPGSMAMGGAKPKRHDAQAPGPDAQ